MSTSRREFVALGSLSLLGTAMAGNAQTPVQQDAPPGAPTAFGTSPAAGPEVSVGTFKEAEKLMQVDMKEADLAVAAGNWRVQMAPVYERRVGPHKLALESTLPPATTWNPTLPGIATGMPTADRFERSADPHRPLPAQEEDIAFAPVAQLSRWIESRQLTSERLTQIYLRRIERFDPKLHCVITLLRDHALEQARKADAEIAAGHYRGPLHGIPWGAKDLLDTAGIRTTYGAEPYRDRVPVEDSAVVKRLNAAGAVLLAK
ncbi:MAG: amidase family protein, partial [Terracidiphilus sp.]